MHTWKFKLKTKSHQIDFWDSRISGKKKLSLDGKIIHFMKECQEHYKFSFKVDEYNFTIKQITDEKFKMEINNKDFMDLMKEERTGEFQRKKKEYLSSKEKEKKKNNNTEDDYYRKTIKYNGENYFEGEEDMYDIEEQRKRLEEFERKKKKINNEDDDFYGSKKMNNGNKFILDNKTVNTNRMIICNLKDIFGEDNFGNEVQGDEFNFSWGDNGDDNNYIFKQNKNNRNNFIQDSIFNNNNNNGNNNPIYDKKILESNPDYYLNQMSNNLNNANNPHNQAVLNQFLNFNDQNGNNNNPYNYNDQFQNNDGNSNMNSNNFNNMQFQNNNFSGQNNQNGNNKYDDDFNPFDD
mgnify:CR=1 FL=1